jgi:diadenylate cyclase
MYPFFFLILIQGISKMIIILQILDIIFVSIILYYIYNFLKINRAGQMIRGILIFMILTMIAGFLHFTVLEWILRSTWTFSLVVLVIIFQPEIRNILADIGRQRWFISNLQNNNISVLLDSIKYFADNKIGALIVLEQSDNLKNYIENGVKLNANISKELLATIFMPKTPLHDGAVILQNNKIASAASILPLSNEEISKSIGTRHRAGLGMSEFCDAIIIIVSEETGKISLARNKQMKWDINIEKLNDILHKIIGNKTERKIEFIIINLKILCSLKTIKKNFHIKILSLIIGAIFWYYLKIFIIK